MFISLFINYCCCVCVFSLYRWEMILFNRSEYCNYSTNRKRKQQHSQHLTYMWLCICVECNFTNSLLSIFMQEKNAIKIISIYICVFFPFARSFVFGRHFKQRMQLMNECLCFFIGFSWFLFLFQLVKILLLFVRIHKHWNTVYCVYMHSGSSVQHSTRGNYAQIKLCM